MSQKWDDLCFLHWPLHPDHLRSLLPRCIELDIFDGRAWLGIIPFNLACIRLRGLPPLPGLSHFSEINLRTYVHRDGRPGIWFFSLDANHAIISAIARRWFHLPYRHSHVALRRCDGWIEYACHKTQTGSVSIDFNARYRPCGPLIHAVPGTLAHWLTERYCLYTTDHAGQFFRAEITHPPWPLQEGEAQIAGNTLASATGIHLPDAQPLVHFSKSITALIWPPERIFRETAQAQGMNASGMCRTRVLPSSSSTTLTTSKR